jgi:hypothetical protein
LACKMATTPHESRAKAGRPTGGRAYGYRDSKIDRGEAFIVLELFGKFADGISARSIAADFNARRIPSPGASWKRSQRRAEGWMGSGIRVIVRNERYRGVLHWNASEWRKDPYTGKRKRVMRPRSEWISSVDESLRIVSCCSIPSARAYSRPEGSSAWRRKCELRMLHTCALFKCVRRNDRRNYRS